MAARASVAETQLRIQKIIELQREFKSTGDIVRYAADNWGIQRRATETLISKATAELTSQFGDERKEIAARLADHHYDIARRSVKADQFSPAVGALKEIARLTGANAPEEHNHNLPQPKLYVGWSPEVWDDDPPTVEGGSDDAPSEAE